MLLPDVKAKPLPGDTDLHTLRFSENGKRLAIGGSLGLGYMNDNGNAITCAGCDVNPVTGEGDFHIGGFIGPSATMLLLLRGADGFRPPMPLSIYPSIWGAAFGLVLGLHLRRRVPVLPGAKWLAVSIYSSPLGGWLGWRQRHVE